MSNLANRAALRRASACYASGNYLEAKIICEELIAANPRDGEALCLRGQIRYVFADSEGAVEDLKKCISQQPRNPRLRWLLAGWLAARGRFAEAVAEYEAALRTNPDDAVILAGLADAFEHWGDLEAAQSTLARVREPDHPAAAHVAATLMIRRKDLRGAIDLLQRHAERRTATPAMLFTLARALEKDGDYDQAFATAQAAHNIERAPFSPGRYIEKIRELMEVFSSERMRRFARASRSSSQPIIVTGRPRSGTTLVESIIAAHPQAMAAGEIPAMYHIGSTLNLAVGSSLPYPACVADMDADDANNASDRYATALLAGRESALRVVDKSLVNMLDLGLVRLLLPNAPIVLCYRDPLDTCISCYMEHMGVNHSYAGTLFDLGLSQRLAEHLMRHWLAVIDGPIIRIDYEDLVNRPDRSARTLIAHVGLDWNEDCLRFHEKRDKRGVTVAPSLSYDQVRMPIYSSSIGRARRFEKHLDPLREGLAEGDRLVSTLA